MSSRAGRFWQKGMEDPFSGWPPTKWRKRMQGFRVEAAYHSARSMQVAVYLIIICTVLGALAGIFISGAPKQKASEEMSANDLQIMRQFASKEYEAYLRQQKQQEAERAAAAAKAREDVGIRLFTGIIMGLIAGAILQMMLCRKSITIDITRDYIRIGGLFGKKYDRRLSPQFTAQPHHNPEISMFHAGSNIVIMFLLGQPKETIDIYGGVNFPPGRYHHPKGLLLVTRLQAIDQNIDVLAEKAAQQSAAGIDPAYGLDWKQRLGQYVWKLFKRLALYLGRCVKQPRGRTRQGQARSQGRQSRGRDGRKQQRRGGQDNRQGREQRQEQQAYRAQMSYYEALDIFGIQEGFTEGELKRRFRQLMEKIHPDHEGSNRIAQLVNEAYEVLKPKAKRGR